MTEYPTSENLTETANELSNVLPNNVQSSWLSQEIKEPKIVAFRNELRDYTS